jgi:outer membrane lipase/esterase
MRQHYFAIALIAAAVLTGCGGNGSSGGDQTLRTKFSAQVSFGDSLSDVGSYGVGTVKALGGGRFGINGDLTAVNPTLTGKNWTELMAAQIGVAAPCPAMTGLDGDATKGFSVPVVLHAGCFGYAQGGSRITNPVGISNKLTGSALGALTVPVAAQIQNHLNVSGGKFSGTELVLVMAGANDALLSLTVMGNGATAAGTTAFGNTLVGLLAAGATSPQSAAQAIGLALQTEAARAGHTDASVVAAAVGAAAVQPGNSAVGAPAVYGPMVASAQAAGAKAGADFAAAAGPGLVTMMATVATELSTLVKTQVIAKGANYVVVNNLPDLGTTPFGKGLDANTLALVNAMVKSFNDTLSAGLASEPKVAYVDTFAASHDQATNPAPYGLTNVTTPACDLTPAKNALGSSLVCNGSNLIAGDVSHYSFADSVHPTPFVQLLLARYVSKYMEQKGWL